jgi:hypothetical protein
MVDAAEEKRQAALAAAQKKKAAVSKGGKAKNAEEVPVALPPPVDQNKINNLKRMLMKQDQSQEDFDLFDPREFSLALRAKIGRRFTFGPIEFTGLDSDDFDQEEAR